MVFSFPACCLLHGFREGGMPFVVIKLLKKMFQVEDNIQ